MHVQIVCRNHTEDLIIPRLARTLANETGWTLGASPDPTADLNYFFPYLELTATRNLFDQTRTAAWFTHLDVGRPEKVKQWQQAAGAVDLRLTSARQYAELLRPLGPTGLVTPPLDREKFRPAQRIPVDRPVVGVSGYVYPGGRKGEHLVKRLAGAGLPIHLRASGKGWPVVDQREYGWAEMQRFFQGLDVYLCTASVEGVPYPPLEALACGVKVVIPQGVGLLDELGEGAGIFRYEAGDYGAMVNSLELAIEWPAEVETLRAATERFTAAAWAQGHERAIDALMTGRGEAEPEPGKWRVKGKQSRIDKLTTSRAGVFYVAYGGPARECVGAAIASLKRHMPQVPVCLVSDQPLGPEDVFVQHPDTDIGARSVKTKIYELAPAEWEFVLYLDADTEIIADISFLFDLLEDGRESFFCVNPAQYVLASQMIRLDNHECHRNLDFSFGPIVVRRPRCYPALHPAPHLVVSRPPPP